MHNRTLMLSGTRKTVLLAVAIMLTALNTYAQRYVPASDTVLHKPLNNSYLRTHKTLKTAAWVSLGVGLATTAVALQSVAASTETGKQVKWLLPVGLSLTGASIPLFVIAHGYKRKAAFLSAGSQQAFTSQNGVSAFRMVPTLCLRVPL